MPAKLNHLLPLWPRKTTKAGFAPITQRLGVRVNADGTTPLDRKPNLTLHENHTKPLMLPIRVWDSAKLGQAVSDGEGWYK